MLQLDRPDDYVVATGRTASVREMRRIAFDRVGLDTSERLAIDRPFYGPAEVDVLLGDTAKALTMLGWKAEIGLEQMIHEMVDADLERVKAHKDRA